MFKLCRVIAFLVFALFQVTARADFPITWRQFQAMTGPEGGQTRYIRDADGDLQRIEARVGGDLLIAVTEEAGGFRLTIGQDLALADIASRGWFSDAESDALTAVYTELQGGGGNRPKRQAGRFRFLAERDPQFRIKPSVLITLAEQPHGEERTSAAKQRPEVTPPRQGSAAHTGRKALEVVQTSLGMNMVLIPAGQFMMGQDEYSTPHAVRITRPFLIGQTEVTQEQWERVMGTTPWKGKSSAKESSTTAASYITWQDAEAFCVALTKAEHESGRLPHSCRFRLPTEAEWEYACRAGTKTRFSFGDDESAGAEYGWVKANAESKGEGYAHKVAVHKPNAWNLFDMHGNVSEWCSDWFDRDYYRRSPIDDPQGPESGNPKDPMRVLRGGCWLSDSGSCAGRNAESPDKSYGTVGFRVVCDVD